MTQHPETLLNSAALLGLFLSDSDKYQKLIEASYDMKQTHELTNNTESQNTRCTVKANYK